MSDRKATGDALGAWGYLLSMVGLVGFLWPVLFPQSEVFDDPLGATYFVLGAAVALLGGIVLLGCSVIVRAIVESRAVDPPEE
ncbi:MAG TPA: hypothetical protein VGB54_11120 [Allosphingosinicella sp.]|jgi:hypothetical protein